MAFAHSSQSLLHTTIYNFNFFSYASKEVKRKGQVGLSKFLTISAAHFRMHLITA